MFYQKTVKYFLIFSFFNIFTVLNSVHAKIIVKTNARVTPSGSGSVYMTIINDWRSR